MQHCAQHHKPLLQETELGNKLSLKELLFCVGIKEKKRDFSLEKYAACWGMNGCFCAYSYLVYINI